ncbi:MAG: TIGR04255 family protein [Bdellovibrionales bacterium]|nr:TIGR04255 family protein [Bdellovibrionales bacterium]
MKSSKTYKNPPLDEMYISIHFQVDPSIEQLDFQQFAIEVEANFKNKEYIFPVIERIGNMEKIITTPEKVWFYSENKTKLLQLGRDRMVYNWRAGEVKPVNYPKYENIKPEFLKYWKILEDYIRRYKNRNLSIKMCELYYSNILEIGAKQFLKNDRDLHKAVNFISPYPEDYKAVTPHISLQIPMDQDTLFLRLEKVKDNKSNRDAFLLVLSIKNNKGFENISEDWYDEANRKIRQFFEDITTESIRNFWKGEINDTP